MAPHGAHRPVVLTQQMTCAHRMLEVGSCLRQSANSRRIAYAQDEGVVRWVDYLCLLNRRQVSLLRSDSGSSGQFDLEKRYQELYELRLAHLLLERLFSDCDHFALPLGLPTWGCRWGKHTFQLAQRHTPHLNGDTMSTVALDRTSILSLERDLAGKELLNHPELLSPAPYTC